MQKKSNKKNKEVNIWLYSKHSSFSALIKKRRKIFKILVTKNTEAELKKFLQKNNLSHLNNLVRIVDAMQIESVVGKNQLHQGIAVQLGRRRRVRRGYQCFHGPQFHAVRSGQTDGRASDYSHLPTALSLLRHQRNGPAAPASRRVEQQPERCRGLLL